MRTVPGTADTRLMHVALPVFWLGYVPLILGTSPADRRQRQESAALNLTLGREATHAVPRYTLPRPEAASRHPARGVFWAASDQPQPLQAGVAILADDDVVMHLDTQRLWPRR